MTRKTGLFFNCKVSGFTEDTFDVAEFHLYEKLSELFTLKLTLVSKQSDIDLDQQLLQTASLTIKVNDTEQRTISGVVASAERGDSGFRRTFYYLTIRPEMWIMSLNQDSRIYQQQSVPDILHSLLQQNNVQSKCTQLQDAHAPREYVTQKRESAYDFFKRLSAEEGIAYWFDDKGLCYSDSHLGMLVATTLTYNPHPQSAIQGDIVHSVRFGAHMRPEQTTQKDRNYHRPSYALKHQASAKSGGKHSVFESYGRFQQDSEAEPFTRYRMEQLQSDSQLGIASSNCIKLMPGRIFIIAEHPVESMNDRWQIVSVDHHGKMPESLEEEDNGEGTTLTNQFMFIPGRNDWRPDYRYKPLADGDEVATVVGPAGEEIYVNEDGCIRVYFHWDRYGKADEKASCWVRVSQAWNGNGFGVMAIPRIGQEVIVSYLNGDIDRPIVTGCTYNGKNHPPYALPSNKTKMVLRSKTYKGGGYNELSFEDATDNEQVYLRAQKNQLITVNNDETIQIGHDRTESVGNDEIVSITHDRKSNTGHDETWSIGHDRRTTVTQDDYLVINRNQKIEISKDYISNIGNHRKEQVTANYQIDTGGNHMHRVVGESLHDASKKLQHKSPQIALDASEKIVLRGPAGKITLDAKGITLEGNIFLKGSVAAMPGAAPSFSGATQASPEEGKPFDDLCSIQPDGNCPLDDCPCDKGNK